MKAIRLRKQRGVTFVEYALLGALIAVVVAVTITALATALQGTFNDIIGIL